MKTITIKTSHSTITGSLVCESYTSYILADVTIEGINETRSYEGYSVPKSMALNVKIK